MAESAKNLKFFNFQFKLFFCFRHKFLSFLILVIFMFLFISFIILILPIIFYKKTYKFGGVERGFLNLNKISLKRFSVNFFIILIIFIIFDLELIFLILILLNINLYISFFILIIFLSTFWIEIFINKIKWIS